MSNYALLSSGYYRDVDTGLGPYTKSTAGAYALAATTGATVSAAGLSLLASGFWHNTVDGSGPYVQTAPGVFALAS
jgi:hypothetical protein